MNTLDNLDRVQDSMLSNGAEKVVWIERSLLLLLFAGLLIGVLAVLKPFTTALLFGAALASAAWPLRQILVDRGLGRGAAATILLFLSIAFVAVPMLIIAPHLAEQVGEGMQRAETYFAAAPEQPSWLAGLPLVGKRLTAAWARMAEVQATYMLCWNPMQPMFKT